MGQAKGIALFFAIGLALSTGIEQRSADAKCLGEVAQFEFRSYELVATLDAEDNDVEGADWSRVVLTANTASGPSEPNVQRPDAIMRFDAPGSSQELALVEVAP